MAHGIALLPQRFSLFRGRNQLAWQHWGGRQPGIMSRSPVRLWLFPPPLAASLGTAAGACPAPLPARASSLRACPACSPTARRGIAAATLLVAQALRVVVQALWQGWGRELAREAAQGRRGIAVLSIPNYKPGVAKLSAPVLLGGLGACGCSMTHDMLGTVGFCRSSGVRAQQSCPGRVGRKDSTQQQLSR